MWPVLMHVDICVCVCKLWYGIALPLTEKADQLGLLWHQWGKQVWASVPWAVTWRQVVRSCWTSSSSRRQWPQKLGLFQQFLLKRFFLRLLFCELSQACIPCHCSYPFLRCMVRAVTTHDWIGILCFHVVSFHWINAEWIACLFFSEGFWILCKLPKTLTCTVASLSTCLARHGKRMWIKANCAHGDATRTASTIAGRAAPEGLPEDPDVVAGMASQWV